MKKLARLNLEKLAEEMQKMNDDEINSVVAGDMYYLSKSDKFISSGTGDNIRIANMSESEFWITNSNSLWMNSTSWSNSSQASQDAALTCIAKSKGINADIVIDDYDSSGSSLAQTNKSYIAGSGTIISQSVKVNSLGRFFDEGNYYNFASIFDHESVHVNKQGIITDANRYQCEQESYYHQINGSSDFRRTSSGFQSFIQNGAATYGVFNYY